MKKHIFIIIIIILQIAMIKVYAQRDSTFYNFDIDSTMIKFAVDVINNPYKLKDLQKYYPGYYDSNFISYDYEDTIIRKKWEDLLFDFPEITDANIKIRVIGFDFEIIDDAVKHMKYKELRAYDFFNIVVMKSCAEGVIFYFIRQNNKYYFHDLHEFRLYSGNQLKDCD
ncbi:MAG: hypothetical protein ABFD00_02330 [Chloroherpetonaceae bacterium]